jgi:dTMP kinase
MKSGRQRGWFISLEGSEGCGKSTQSQRLADRLRSEGFPVLAVREPGGTPLGEEIRGLLKYAASGQGMTPEAEFLLFSASRAQLVREVISPALAAGQSVVCDRFADSSTAYQGAGRGLDLGVIRQVHSSVVGEVWPDITLLLDMDAEQAWQRAHQRNREEGAPADRMESEALSFYQRVRQGYLAMAAEYPARFRVVPADDTPDVVADRVWEAVRHVIYRG